MSQATVQFQLGAETVTSILDIELSGETIITGDFGGLIPVGTVARLRGAVNLTGNMHVRGTLLCDPSGVNLNGNGFDIHTHDGTLNLVGVEKTAWLRWGDTPVGWQIGDRLAVAPTAVGVFVPSETTWQGSWAATTRPANSPDVTLPDGSTARPEVANLSQTVTLRNLQRIMIHEASAPNPQTFKWIKVLDSGETGVLGHYPIHFHQIYDNARGSILEGVVVEGGKNHAFVPHGSHGITYRDCVAFNTAGDAFWWDFPVIKQDTTNNSNDVTVDHMLIMWVLGTALKRGGFVLGAGSGNSVIESVATCVQGGKDASGFLWPEEVNQNVGGVVWDFHHNLAHNNKSDGIHVWQNDSSPHLIEDCIGYRNGLSQIDHGAYINSYAYKRCVLMGGTEAFKLHAVGPIVLEDFITDRPLLLPRHQARATVFTTVRRCQFTGVVYMETGNGGTERSLMRFEDCGLDPSDFDLAGVVAASEIEIFEAGVLTDRWAAGVWS